MKHLYIIAGFLSLAIGAVGAALPVLPTTPFLLITLYCFAKGSDRFHRWFVSTRLYERHLARFVSERALTRRAKIQILAYASSMLAVAFLLTDNRHLRLFIVALAAAKYYYFIFRIKTVGESAPPEFRPSSPEPHPEKEPMT